MYWLSQETVRRKSPKHVLRIKCNQSWKSPVRGSSSSRSLLWQWSVSSLPRLAGKSCPLRCPQGADWPLQSAQQPTYHPEAIRIRPSLPSLLPFNIKQNTFDYFMPSPLPDNKVKNSWDLHSTQSLPLQFIVWQRQESKPASLSKTNPTEKSLKIRQGHNC